MVVYVPITIIIIIIIIIITFLWFSFQASLSHQLIVFERSLSIQDSAQYFGRSQI